MSEFTMCSRCEEKPAAICISCLTDCTLKQQPTAGEWTKIMREKWLPKPINIDRILSEAVSTIAVACDRLDTAEAKNRKYSREITEARQGAFGFMIKAEESLWEGMSRNYAEFDDVRTELNTKLDTAEARLKNLLAVCKDTLPALKKIKETQQIDPFYLDTLITVLDNAIAKELGSRPPVEGETDNPDQPPKVAKAKKEGGE